MTKVVVFYDDNDSKTLYHNNQIQIVRCYESQYFHNKVSINKLILVNYSGYISCEFELILTKNMNNNLFG